MQREERMRGKIQINVEGGRCVYKQGWCGGGAGDGSRLNMYVCIVVVSIAACYHPPEPGRQFD